MTPSKGIKAGFQTAPLSTKYDCGQDGEMSPPGFGDSVMVLAQFGTSSASLRRPALSLGRGISRAENLYVGDPSLRLKAAPLRMTPSKGIKAGFQTAPLSSKYDCGQDGEVRSSGFGNSVMVLAQFETSSVSLRRPALSLAGRGISRAENLYVGDPSLRLKSGSAQDDVLKRDQCWISNCTTTPKVRKSKSTKLLD